MDKIAGPAELAGKISLEADVAYNIEAASQALDKPVRDLLTVVMDRPRHENLIRELRDLDVKVRLIGDGDVSAALDAANPDSEVDMLIGIGAAPEGVITATALRGLGAHFEGQLVFKNDGHRERAEDMIDGDIERIWQRDDLCTSDDAIFVASGVCSGYLPGVEFLPGRTAVHSEIIDVLQGTRRFVSNDYPR
jgi:fructose-1,6-bisphosphatase/sedoheptulose 1,7-bisphosphatase-like protein